VIIVELKVIAYIQEGFDLRTAVQERLLAEDWVSYCDVDTVSEESTNKTFPDDDEGEDCEDDEKGKMHRIIPIIRHPDGTEDILPNDDGACYWKVCEGDKWIADFWRKDFAELLILVLNRRISMGAIKCEHAEGGKCITGKTTCLPLSKGYICPRIKVNGPLDWFNPADSIAIIWSIDDIIQERPYLTHEQAMKVLEEVSDSHDANYGVNWDTLRDTADSMFPKQDKDEEE